MIAFWSLFLFFSVSLANSFDFAWKSCPNFKDFSTRKHFPFAGSLKLPFQRPVQACRTFHSKAVEQTIDDVKSRLADEDLARLFENCMPNTLDTTIRWHSDHSDHPQTLVITGDIPAEWIRDSANQLAPYLPLVKSDRPLSSLILGAIQTQAEMLIQFPYCNAFQPPKQSHIGGNDNGQSDRVTPAYDPQVVFECKYELDSLAAFLKLSYNYWLYSKDSSIFSAKWVSTIQVIFRVLEEQSTPTFDEDTGFPKNPVYTFLRQTDSGTETLGLSGRGFPLNKNSSLIRTAFRPSDDTSILQYLIPANAMMVVELSHLHEMLQAAGHADLAKLAMSWARRISNGIREHGIVDHPKFGKVYAYEVDGYGSAIFMDDANIPSLLSLPYLGYVERDDPVYLNTRKMILSPEGNPYFLKGTVISGIGGPHIGLRNVWPMSLIVQAFTSDDDDEIRSLLNTIKHSTNSLGLMHESVDITSFARYTRSWFSWANSLYSELILDLLERKPHLLKKNHSG
ncbi:alpha-mannosidase GH125 family Mug157 [Schizosaccharomyces osmophilus]|uniref:Alpha-mannosidase GH125 family Mug157 n=1 Tax=Schizosaccharomyces osmophilus TaxID=2545709 RepID=A0AAE9WFX9_9SCHI|nr:alpha-mannosidase GH125 family Mug157 [Schizosaccharomyces osmophilus]WBW74436.1 alpha-mannosidase GH125 family Mug157 [Schizosaccharomyces osmophilus]